MEITNKLVEFLDKFNGQYKENEYIESEFRVYYILKNSNIENAICINRKNHTLAQANKITKEFMSVMYDDRYVCEYTGQITEDKIQPYESTGEYEYLEHAPSLYVM